MNYEFWIQQAMLNPFDLNQEYEASKRSVTYDESCEELAGEIRMKIHEIERNGFEAEYILMNMRNYERIIAYVTHNRYGSSPPDTFQGYQIIIWDVPVDFVNVRCKASEEWAYGDAIRKDARK